MHPVTFKRKILTLTLSGLDFVYAVGMAAEFKDNNEKSCSWSRNRVSQWEILIKSILEPYGRSTAMSTAWELTTAVSIFLFRIFVCLFEK